MSISFACQGCGHGYEVDERLAGKRGRCKRCGHTFEIPAAVDPYGLDELPRGGGPAEAESPSLARATKPERTGKSKAKAGRSFFGLPSRGVLAALGAYSLVFLIAWAYHPVADLSIALFGVSAAILLLVGYLGLVSAAFRLGTTTGLVALLKPGRIVYTNWRLTRPWVLTLGGSFAALLGAVLLILAFDASGAHEAEHEEIEMRLGLRPELVQRREAQARLEALKRKIAEDAARPQPEIRQLDAIPKGPLSGARAKRKAEGPDLARATPPEVPPDTPPRAADDRAPEAAPAAQPESAEPAAKAGRPFRRPAMKRPPSPFGPAGGPPFGPRGPQMAQAGPVVTPGPGAGPATIGPEAVDLDRALAGLKANDPQSRRDALGRLSRARVDEARRAEVVGAIVPLLRPPAGPWVRGDAAKALGVWGRAEDVPTLIEALKDPDFTVRWAAMDALARFKDAAGAEAVAEIFPTHSARAGEALRSMGPVAEPAVRKLLGAESPFARADACRILKEIGTADSLAALKALRDRTKGQGPDGSAAEDAIRVLEARGPSPRAEGP